MNCSSHVRFYYVVEYGECTFMGILKVTCHSIIFSEKTVRLSDRIISLLRYCTDLDEIWYMGIILSFEMSREEFSLGSHLPNITPSVHSLQIKIYSFSKKWLII
jgi:hypothetical protein